MQVLLKSSYEETPENIKTNPISDDILTALEEKDNIEIFIDNINIARHIENILREYVDFLDDEETNCILRTKVQWLSIQEIETIKENFEEFLKNIYRVIKLTNIEIKGQNSVIDILGNGPSIYIQYIKRLLSKDNTEEEQLKNTSKKIYELMKIIVFYMKSISVKNDHLYLALTNPDGYITVYDSYFFEKDIEPGMKHRFYPGGSKKLQYFYFFLKYENGEISADNLNEELSQLENEFIDKELIRKDFPHLRKKKHI